MPPQYEFSSHLTTLDGYTFWFRIAENNQQRNAMLMMGDGMQMNFNTVSGDNVPIPHLVYYKDQSCEFIWGHLTLAINGETIKRLERQFSERRTRMGHQVAFLPWCIQ